MIITETKFNSLPEQVEQNKRNIKLLDAALEAVQSGKMIGKNIWKNPDASQPFENQVITSEELLKPYNVLKIYFINNVAASEATVQTIVLDLSTNYPVEVSYQTAPDKHFRTVKFNALNNEIEFSDEQIVDILDGSTPAANNEYLVPLAVVGYIEEVQNDDN